MEGLKKQLKPQIEEADKDLIRERIRAKLRLRSKGYEAVFTDEELAIMQEDREEDIESRDLSGH